MSVGIKITLALFLVGCGSNGGGNGASGVQSSRMLVSLSAAEYGQLCDWMVARAGSYGTPGACDMSQGAFLAYSDQADCVEDGPNPDSGCTATVAELEVCVNALGACATVADLTAAPACAVLMSRGRC